MQEDIEDVSRTARQVKNRLERLDKVNEQALSRKVCPAQQSSSIVTISQLTCPCALQTLYSCSACAAEGCTDRCMTGLLLSHAPPGWRRLAVIPPVATHRQLWLSNVC